MKIKTRKMLFLSTIISRGTPLRKSPDDDGIEVGPGFADAAARANSDDTRTVTPTPTPAPAASDDDGGEGDEGDDGDDGDEGQGDEGDGGEGDEPRKRKTSQFIREEKARRREAERKVDILEQRLYMHEKGLLQKPNGADTPANHEEPPAPDPKDEAKYPLGVLDDRYIEDKIEWVADKKVRDNLDGERQTARARETAAAETERLQSLKTQVDELTDKGSELFDDFEDKVLEGGMKGKWDLSEPTFHAAAESTHGARILHALASDKTEASRVAKLSPFQQAKYVLEKDAEYEAKLPKARTKPKAEDVPSNSPRGRNSSNPIRPDTDNLNDFRKIWYAKK